MRFKVGDKVRIIHNFYGSNWIVGRTGYIDSVDSDSDMPYSISNHPYSNWRDEELELVEEDDFMSSDKSCIKGINENAVKSTLNKVLEDLNTAYMASKREDCDMLIKLAECKINTLIDVIEFK